jgi:hypothetical protein
MKQDLRTLFEKERTRKHKMKEGHEARFEQRLNEAFPKRRLPLFYVLGIAASVVVLIGLGIVFTRQMQTDDPVRTTVLEKQPRQEGSYAISLGDLSPDLKKVETFYVNSINLELSELDLTGEYKEVVDDFMGRLSELDQDYKKLTMELNEIGPNEQTISAMIQNLQLRLQILQKLKEKLNQLKSSKNETVTNIQV